MSYQFCESGGVEGAGPHEKPKAEGVRGLETRKERGEETAPVDSTGSPQTQPKGTAGLLGSQSTIKTVINHKSDLEGASEVN